MIVSTIAVVLTFNAVLAFGDMVVSPPLDSSANMIPKIPQIKDIYTQQIVETAITLNTTAAVVIDAERLSAGIWLF